VPKIEESKNMRTTFAAILCSTLIGSWVAWSPALAQQKTVKACQEEWRANKADNQAKGITEKAYVDECRAGNAAAKPAAAPATAKPAPTTAAPAAAKPAPTVAAPPATNPAPTVAAPAPAAAPASKRTPAAAATPTGANQFSTEAQARAHCPSDAVVWANLTSKIFHFTGYKDYGKTKNGAYMCENDATSGGFRASKTEKPPA
jgi:hypothetical protein